MDGERPAGAALLSLLYAVSGSLCLLGALRPLSERTPVGLLWALSAIGCTGALLLWAFRAGLTGRVLQVAVVVMSTLIGLLAWRSVTAVGVIGLGPSLVAVGTFAGHFLPARAARAQVAYLLVVSTAGALAAPPSGILLPWLTSVVTVIALSEAQVRLSGALRRTAGTDPLTGLANRRAWAAGASRHLAHAQRSGEPLTVAILDLDGFKEINDAAGHGAGDALLRDLARQWTAQLRGADLLGRYGGDEFVLCLPATDATRAADLLQRLRASHPASWSAGTATAVPGDTLDELLERADAVLYRNKRRSDRTS